MATSQAVKKNISSMQVLKTLQVLLEDNYTMSELIKKLNENEKNIVFNNSVVSKYINTCRYCGIEIPKIHNKYFVSRLPFGLDLTTVDLDLFKILQKAAKNTLTKKYKKQFDDFIARLSKYSNRKIVKVEKNNIEFVLEAFEKAKEEKRFVNLMLRTKNVIQGVPLEITENKGRTFLNIRYEGKEKLISADSLTGLEIVSEKFITNFSDTTVIYTLKGELAERYNLKENESLLDVEKNFKRISCRGENKDVLFARLLRYDSCCEVELPKSYREEMKTLILEALSNYGE